jgi:signal peptide peptidase SppA
MMRREEVLRLFGAKPLLVEATKLDAAYGARKPYPVQEGVAVIDIAGVLANEPSLFDAILFGATAYGEILDEVEQAIADPEVRAVLLRVNSPGGDSENAFETAAALTALARQKPIWAVADNSMFSAAYLLATAAERIYVPEFTGGVGSIGIYAEHLDWSEYNRKLGVKVTYIAEGEGKTDGNPNEPLSEAARAALEAEVRRLYGLFVEAVARRRGLSEQAIRDMGAALKYGPEAVAAGLADRTGTFRTALADLAAFVKPTSIPQGGRRMNEEPVRAEAPEPTIDLEAIRAEAHREGYAEAREIVELCALAGLPAKAATLLARGATPTEARQYLIEARAAEDAPEIRSHVMPDAGTSAKVPLEQNPVLKAVERLAKGVN